MWDQQPLNPRRLGHKQGGDKEEWILEKAKPALHSTLLLIGGQHFRVTQLAIRDRGPKHETGLLLLLLFDSIRIRHDGGMYLPANRLDRRLESGLAAFSIRKMRGKRGAIQFVIVERLDDGFQGRLGRLWGSKALGLEMKELFVPLFLFFVLRLSECGFCPLPRRLGIAHEPALRDAVGTEIDALIGVCPTQRLPLRPGPSLGDHLLSDLEGLGNPGNKRKTG